MYTLKYFIDCSFHYLVIAFLPVFSSKMEAHSLVGEKRHELSHVIGMSSLVDENIAFGVGFESIFEKFC